MMTIPIPCPQCRRELKLPDRSLLGRKGKCPKCQHVFILAEPVAVAVDSAEPSPATTQRVSSDETQSFSASLLPTKKTLVPASKAVPKPAVQSEKSPFEELADTVAEPKQASDPERLTPMPRKLTTPPTPLDFDEFDQLSETEELASRMKKLRKKSWGRRIAGIVMTVVALIAFGAFALIVPRTTSQNPVSTDDPAVVPNSATESREESGSDEKFLAASPTHGKPIDLQYIPFGAQVVLNLHPAELWKPNSPGEEIRFCIPPIAKLVETTLNDLFQRKPEQVEELMICLIPGPRGTAPDIAAVVRMVEDQKRSQLLEQFGRRDDSGGTPVFFSGERAYMIVDSKTMTVCPKAQAQEMVQAVNERLVSEMIEPLLPLTDRDRLFTAIFIPSTLELQETWFPETVRPLLRNFLDWLGQEVETVSWSMHLTEEQFYSEILLRNRGAVGVR